MDPFYADRFVRKRLTEFLGGRSRGTATAAYLTHTDGFLFDRRELRPPTELDWFLERDMDISRSLADSKSYLLHLDVEYVNFDSPAAAFVDPSALLRASGTGGAGDRVAAAGMGDPAAACDHRAGASFRVADRPELGVGRADRETESGTGVDRAVHGAAADGARGHSPAGGSGGVRGAWRC